MIDFMNLKISFGKKIIVKEMNDQFSENKIIGLVAPNGTGKTTLLRTLAGIKKPADGYVKINGLDFYSEREEYLKQILFLENSDQLYANLTAQDHFNFTKCAWHSSVDPNAIIRMLKMDSYKNIPIRKLSLGMKQHVLIGMYAISDAPILLLDEPMNGLDPTSLRIVNNLLRSLKENGKTIIFSSHDLTNVHTICDEVLFLHAQKVIIVENTRDIKQSYDELYLSEDVILP